MAAKKDDKKKVRKPLTHLDKLTIGEIVKCADTVHGTIEKQGKPELKFPERSLRNAKYDKKGGFQMGRREVRRAARVRRGDGRHRGAVLARRRDA